MDHFMKRIINFDYKNNNGFENDERFTEKFKHLT